MLQVNEYFDGNVKSIAFNNREGKITSGVMAPGEYEFGTTEHERVRIVSGEFQVKLPDSDSYESYKVGDEFQVAANQRFQLVIEQASAYLCYYT
jgi:uncharacterized protein YaiE (UPF0345 family)